MEENSRGFRVNAQPNAQLKKRNHLQKMAADKISLYERLAQPRRRNDQRANTTSQHTNGSKEKVSVDNHQQHHRMDSGSRRASVK